MAVQIQVRRDSAANWASYNPTLALGEIGYDTTNQLVKLGNGVDPWNSLSTMPVSLDSLVPGSGLGIDVLPDSDLTYSLGAPDFRFLDIHGDLDGGVIIYARVNETAGVTKGQVVYISGTHGNDEDPEISLADASDPSKMPAFGLVRDDAANGEYTHVVTLGSLTGLVLTGVYNEGDVLYVSTTPGEFTNTKPLGESNLVQNIGYIVKKGNGTGVIRVGGAGRTNAVPNLDENHIFIGDASGDAISVDINEVVPPPANLTFTADAGTDVVYPATTTIDIQGGTSITTTSNAANGLVTVVHKPPSIGTTYSNLASFQVDATGHVSNVLTLSKAPLDPDLNLGDVTDPAAARDNLGLGTSVTEDLGDYSNAPSATTVRQFDDLVFHGVSSSTGLLQTQAGTFGTSGWTWRSDYSTSLFNYQDDDAIGVVWASEAGAYDRGTFYGPPSILRASPSDGDKCLFECRVRFAFHPSATSAFVAVGFASTQSNNNHQSTFMTPIYGGASRAGIYFQAGQTYLRSFSYDNWGVNGGSTQADITSVSNANGTWFQLGAVCTYDAANTRWVVDSYCDGVLVATNYLTTWGPPPSYGLTCYNNSDALTNGYAVDWVSAEYIRYQNPTLLHIEDV